MNHLLRKSAAARPLLLQRGFHATPARATTILCVRKNGKVCMMGDGMVSQGSMIVKANTNKIRTIKEGTLVGFAGSTADAFTLLDRLEGKLDEYPGQLTRAAVELAKGWRTDKYLRRLEASIVVADAKVSLEVTGNGDVLESVDGILGVGSGSPYAIGTSMLSSRLSYCVPSGNLMFRNIPLFLFVFFHLFTNFF